MLEVDGRAYKQKLTSRESANSFLVRRPKAFANEAAEKNCTRKARRRKSKSESKTFCYKESTVK